MKLTSNIDKLGLIGIILTVFFSPCCFPLFAFGASALGLGSFELFGGWTMWVLQAMVLVSLIGLVISYRKHRCLYPLLVAFPSMLIMFSGFYLITEDYWIYFIYAGMSGLFVATIWNYRRNKLHQPKTKLESIITCPDCGFSKKETMSTNSCQYFYDCQQCKTVLKAKEGDCCVYCSYGTEKCPPMQTGEGCC